MVGLGGREGGCVDRSPSCPAHVAECLLPCGDSDSGYLQQRGENDFHQRRFEV